MLERLPLLRRTGARGRPPCLESPTGTRAVRLTPSPPPSTRRRAEAFSASLPTSSFTSLPPFMHGGRAEQDQLQTLAPGFEVDELVEARAGRAAQRHLARARAAFAPGDGSLQVAALRSGVRVQRSRARRRDHRVTSSPIRVLTAGRGSLVRRDGPARPAKSSPLPWPPRSGGCRRRGTPQRDKPARHVGRLRVVDEQHPSGSSPPPGGGPPREERRPARTASGSIATRQADRTAAIASASSAPPTGAAPARAQQQPLPPQAPPRASATAPPRPRPLSEAHPPRAARDGRDEISIQPGDPATSPSSWRAKIRSWPPGGPQFAVAVGVVGVTFSRTAASGRTPSRPPAGTSISRTIFTRSSTSPHQPLTAAPTLPATATGIPAFAVDMTAQLHRGRLPFVPVTAMVVLPASATPAAARPGPVMPRARATATAGAWARHARAIDDRSHALPACATPSRAGAARRLRLRQRLVPAPAPPLHTDHLLPRVRSASVPAAPSGPPHDQVGPREAAFATSPAPALPVDREADRTAIAAMIQKRG